MQHKFRRPRVTVCHSVCEAHNTSCKEGRDTQSKMPSSLAWLLPSSSDFSHTQHNMQSAVFACMASSKLKQLLPCTQVERRVYIYRYIYVELCIYIHISIYIYIYGRRGSNCILVIVQAVSEIVGFWLSIWAHARTHLTAHMINFRGVCRALPFPSYASWPAEGCTRALGRCALPDHLSRIRKSLAGQDTRRSPERSGIESRWRNSVP